MTPCILYYTEPYRSGNSIEFNVILCGKRNTLYSLKITVFRDMTPCTLYYREPYRSGKSIEFNVILCGKRNTLYSLQINVFRDMTPCILYYTEPYRSGYSIDFNVILCGKRNTLYSLKINVFRDMTPCILYVPLSSDQTARCHITEDTDPSAYSQVLLYWPHGQLTVTVQLVRLTELLHLQMWPFSD